MDRIGRIRTALVPDTLRARLALTVLLTIILVLGGSALLFSAITEAYTREAAQQRVRDRLGHLASYLSLRTDRLSLQALNYTERADTYRYSSIGSTPPAEWLDAEIADWLPLRSSADIGLWRAADGRTLWSLGSEDDVRTLQRFLEANPGRNARGLVELSEGPAIIVAVPVTGFPERPAAGSMVLAALIDDGMVEQFLELNNTSTLTFRPPSPRSAARQPDAISIGPFSGARWYVDHRVLHLAADVIGWDGTAVASIDLEDPEASPSRPIYIPLLITLGAVALAVAASVLLAITTTRLVRRPVDELVDYVTGTVAATVEGAPHEPLPIAPEVPTELRVMMQAVDGLSERLSRRQGELREALRHAQEAEERLRIAVDDSPEAKLLLVDGVVRLANPAAAAQLSASVDGLLGSPVPTMTERSMTVVDSDEPITLPEVIARATDAPVTVTMDSPGRGRRWLEISAVSHPGPGGEVLVTSRDVTEALRRDELRGEILGMVSHDLRSPLAVISGYVDILQREADGEVASKAVSGARKGISRMLELLEDLLTTARAEELLAPQTMSPVRLDLLATEIAEVARTTANQELVVSACCEAATRGEERRLRQALLNMVGNAVKYSPDDSTIRVSVECADGRVLVAVEDQGPGIPAEDRQRIFERFSRIQRQEGREKPGFGLGLYIVRAIVTGHGGSVYVEDAPSGTGSRFVMDLPSR